WHGRHRARVLLAEYGLDPLFNLHVRHHLAANFAESGQAISDSNEPRVVDAADVTRDVPAIPNDLARPFRLTKVAQHPIRTVDEQKSLCAKQRTLEGYRTDDLGDDTRNRMTDRPRARAALVLAAVIDVGHVHRHDRRHLGAAVPFQEIETE